MVNIIKTFRTAQKRGYRPPRLLLMFCSLFAINTTLLSIASAANSLSQFGITWTFDKELSTNGAANTYHYGQFANGDYWVVPDTPGVNVTIIGIEPASLGYLRLYRNDLIVTGNFSPGEKVQQGSVSGIVHSFGVNDDPGTYMDWVEINLEPDSIVGTFVADQDVVGENGGILIPTAVDIRDMHGSMINPSPWKYYDGPTGSQGFDSATGFYDASYNVALDVNEINPLVVPPQSSLISVISKATLARETLRGASILTVLPETPPENGFRPSYCGDDKTIKFNVDNLNYNILGSLTPVAGAEDINDVADEFERPWIDFWPGSGGRTFHPTNNMPDYGGIVTWKIGRGALMLNCNFTNAEKETLMIRFAQLGIDYYGIVSDDGEQVFIPDGGHGGGRKWPILFAGLVLNDPDMKYIGQKSGNYLYSDGYGTGNPPPDYIHFGEDSQIFYVKDADIYSQPYKLRAFYTIETSISTSKGNVKVTNNSKIVEGVGTTWLDDLDETKDFLFGVEGDNQAYSPTGRAYKVDSIDSNTQLTLNINYNGDTDLTGNAIYKLSAYWLAYGHGAKSNLRDYEEYTSEHLGLPEFGQRHAAIPLYDGLDWSAAYRTGHCWQGQLMSALIMDAKELWNHDALFDYMDRYMSVMLELYGHGYWQRCIDPWIEDMWDEQRADYGPVWSANPADPNNPSPELQAIGDKFVDENVALTFDVNATDPNGEPITYSAQGLPSGAMFDPLTGEFAWTPSYQQASSYQVRFIASDGNSWDSETITITVNNVNRPPVLGAITDQSVNENAILSLSVEASDPDGQALTYSVSGLPAGAVFVSQTLTWTPSYDQAGTFGVTFTADDGQAQDSEAITITVINVNRTPVLAAINNQSVWADDPLTFTIDATDPDGDTVTYSASNLPSSATFTGQDFDWTPGQGQMGSYDVTFIATDGQLQDSQMVTITVDVDSLAPTVTNSLPTAGSIQAPLNNLINLNITDAGKGIDADSVTIKVNNNTVYTDDTNHYSSPDGECRRLGNKADYRFVYQSNEEFDYDQTVSITVNATDLAGNVMSENSYSFVTEMRSFGQNMMVNSGSVNLNSGRPVTVRDSSGNIWAAWHAGPIDNRDIYIGKLAAGQENFGGTVQLTDNTTDQCNPAVALDSSDKLYVVWQDNREGDWDIYVSTSVDGISWTTETRVNDPNDGDQVNPAIVIDGQSPNQAYVVWQDDRAGSQDICVATSSDGFVTTTVLQITSHISDQVEPAIAADSDNTIYIVWTDGRNGSNDIYGAASNNGLWNNVPVVTEDDGQSSPAIATEAVGSILHLVWVDDRLGDDDIYYDKTVAGLSPLTGSSIIDDTTGADQISPVIITTGYIGNDLKVFVCWRDERNADADLYFVEIGSDNETNVFVGDDGTSTDQSEPAIGIDGDDYPYLLWTNERTDIYYAGSTFVEPVALASTNVSVSSTATVGTVWNAVNSLDDVSAEVPQGAYLCDVKITISKIKNPPKSNLELDLFSGTYEFSPSGMEFIEPVTITIPYEVNGSENVLYTAYWYNPLTNTLSQQGITDVETIVISSTLHAVRFKTTHFSAFILGGGVAAALGGGGGGCSVSAGSEGNIVEFVLPYIGLVVVMAMLKVRDARERKARNT